MFFPGKSPYLRLWGENILPVPLPPVCGLTYFIRMEHLKEQRVAGDPRGTSQGSVLRSCSCRLCLHLLGLGLRAGQRPRLVSFQTAAGQKAPEVKPWSVREKKLMGVEGGQGSRVIVRGGVWDTGRRVCLGLWALVFCLSLFKPLTKDIRSLSFRERGREREKHRPVASIRTLTGTEPTAWARALTGMGLVTFR